MIYWYSLAFAGGYVAAVFTWDKLHAVIIGVEAKAAKLKQKAKDLVS